MFKLKRNTRSLLEELNSVKHSHDRKHVIERTGESLIQRAINLFEEFHRNYDTETAVDLEHRLINSIRHQDLNRFRRGIKRAATNENKK